MINLNGYRSVVKGYVVPPLQKHFSDVNQYVPVSSVEQYNIFHICGADDETYISSTICYNSISKELLSSDFGQWEQTHSSFIKKFWRPDGTPSALPDRKEYHRTSVKKKEELFHLYVLNGLMYCQEEGKETDLVAAIVLKDPSSLIGEQGAKASKSEFLESVFSSGNPQYKIMISPKLHHASLSNFFTKFNNEVLLPALDLGVEVVLAADLENLMFNPEVVLDFSKCRKPADRSKVYAELKEYALDFESEEGETAALPVAPVAEVKKEEPVIVVEGWRPDGF